MKNLFNLVYLGIFANTVLVPFSVNGMDEKDPKSPSQHNVGSSSAAGNAAGSSSSNQEATDWPTRLQQNWRGIVAMMVSVEETCYLRPSYSSKGNGNSAIYENGTFNQNRWQKISQFAGLTPREHAFLYLMEALTNFQHIHTEERAIDKIKNRRYWYNTISRI